LGTSEDVKSSEIDNNWKQFAFELPPLDLLLVESL